MLKDSGANTPESKLFIGQQIANGYSYTNTDPERHEIRIEMGKKL